jgi:hypothetical protein
MSPKEPSAPTDGAPRVMAPKSPTLPPRRGPTHRVDTVAFRKLLNHLKPDWLVRHMEERDYGIDLQLELFDDASPTGVMVFGQLKGTEKSFEDEDSFPLDVGTLLYAELFSAPFFLLRTSIADNVTRFVWLQKYIETELDPKGLEWRSQGAKSIKMPPTNDLVENADRFIALAKKQLRDQQALKFLRIESILSLHAPQVLKGEFKMGFYCSSEAKKLEQLEAFIVDDDMNGCDLYARLSTLYDHFDKIAIFKKVAAENRRAIENALDEMSTMKITYLVEPMNHAFITANSESIYY